MYPRKKTPIMYRTFWVILKMAGNIYLLANHFIEIDTICRKKHTVIDQLPLIQTI